MKKENPTLHDTNNITKAVEAGNTTVRHVFRLGLDVDLRLVVVAVQCNNGAIQLAQMFSRARLIQWIGKQVTAGHEVHTVYEGAALAIACSDLFGGMVRTSAISAEVRKPPTL